MARLSLAAILCGALLLPVAAPAQSGCNSQPPFPVPFPTTDQSAPVPDEPAAVITGFRTDATDRLQSWRFWWEMNKDRWYRVPERQDPQAEEPEVAAVAAALGSILRRADQRDLLAATTLALGKVGRDAGAPLPDLLRANLAAGNRIVRHAAVLGLGLSGRAEAVADLVALVGDTPAGRRLNGKPSVEDRMRYLAAYGLGLAARQGDAVSRVAACEALGNILGDRRNRDRDLKLAAVNALGLLRPGAEVRGRDRLVVWRCADHLWRYFERDLGKSEELIQAQVPPAIARLVGRQAGADRERYLARFAELLERGRAKDAILQSAALAIGGMALPAPQAGDVDRRATAALQRYYQKGKDDLARHFCLLALADIGGDSRDFLLRALGRARHLDRSWAALALGVLARNRYECDDVAYLDNPDVTLGDALRKTLDKARDPDTRAAVMIALGLSAWPGHRPGQVAAEIAELMDRSSPEDVLAGYGCEALALLGASEARPRVAKVLDESRRRPWLFQQAAKALAVLGEPDLPGRLRKAFGDDWNVSDQRLYAATLGVAGQRRDAVELLARLRDPDAVDQTRAVIAAALGDLYRREPWRFGFVVAGGMNYAAALLALGESDSELLALL